MVSAVFLPVLAISLLLPPVSVNYGPAQAQTAESGLLRLDPGLLTNRGGRLSTPEIADPAPAAANTQPNVGIFLHIRGTSHEISTAGVTLKEGLARAGVFPNPSDLLRPALDSPLLNGMHVYLQESLPVVIYADGGVASHYTLQPTVGAALAEMGVPVRESDRVQPGLDSLVLGPTTIRVTRVSEEMLSEEEELEFQVIRQPSDDLEVNTESVAQHGEEGLLRRTIRVDYEDGQEVGRTLEKEWVEKEPVPTVILYGTKVIWRTVDSPSGPLKYREKRRMFATSYDASGGGKDPGHPAYGITFTGMIAGRGVVAVDPRVIPLYTRLYVPGYGVAVAGDTGGGVKGDHIDLGFEEGETGLWSSRWVDVYILN